MKPLITLLLISFWIIGNGQKVKSRTMSVKEMTEVWPVPKNPIDGEMWVQNGHYWMQVNGEMMIVDKLVMEDSLQAERFFNDSLGNNFMVEYRYAGKVNDTANRILNIMDTEVGETIKEHSHFVAICKIISYKGNKQHIVADNIKAIYSPVECEADCTKLWLQRLYKLQNKR